MEFEHAKLCPICIDGAIGCNCMLFHFFRISASWIHKDSII